jgi:hypothetical protein
MDFVFLLLIINTCLGWLGMSDKIKQFCNRYKLSADKWKDF